MAFRTQMFLRRADREDLDAVVAWMEDPDFLRFLYGDPTRSPRQVRERIVQMLGRSSGATMPDGIYLIIDSPPDGAVGLVALQNISWRNRSCSVDFYVGQKKLRGRLGVSIAGFRALEYCFNELNLHRISAYIYSFNTPSWRLMERTGATRELTLRDHIMRDGQYHDMYCYGLLRHEFQALLDAHPQLRGFSSGANAQPAPPATSPSSAPEAVL
jgi:RimJ/RimL family protein N-acetyltransferase